MLGKICFAQRSAVLVLLIFGVLLGAAWAQTEFYLATVDDSFNYWTQQNGCTSFQNNLPLCQNEAPNQGTTGNDATACVNNAEVQFIWEEGVGHAWVNSQDAARWQFLAAHPKAE